MGCLSKLGQYPSTGPPTYQIIKVPNANHMNVMKTSLTIFPCVLGSAFLYISVCPGLSFATKRIGPPCCTLFTFVTCCSLQIILSQNYLLPLVSVLAENTLLETAYHFLLLLVGFDTLTYRKDYDRSPILVGHQQASRNGRRNEGSSIPHLQSLPTTPNTPNDA